MICLKLEAAAADDEGAIGDCSWSIILAGIRRHAGEQPAEVQADLNAWADLLEGVAELLALRRR
jgi:hypothetical protein